MWCGWWSRLDLSPEPARWTTQCITHSLFRQKRSLICCSHKIIFKAKYYSSPSSSWENNSPLGWEPCILTEERGGGSMPRMLSSCEDGQSVSVRAGWTHGHTLEVTPGRWPCQGLQRAGVGSTVGSRRVPDTRTPGGKLFPAHLSNFLINSRRKAQFGLTCLRHLSNFSWHHFVCCFCF